MPFHVTESSDQIGRGRSVTKMEPTPDLNPLTSHSFSPSRPATQTDVDSTKFDPLSTAPSQDPVRVDRLPTDARANEQVASEEVCGAL